MRPLSLSQIVSPSLMHNEVAVDIPSVTCSDTATLIEAADGYERRRSSSTNVHHYDPLDIAAARRYARQIADLNVLLCLFDTGFLGRKKEVRYEVLDLATALYAETEARARGAERLRRARSRYQGHRSQAQENESTPRIGLELLTEETHDRGCDVDQDFLASSVADEVAGSYKACDCSLDSALAQPSRLARLTLGPRQAMARQHRRVIDAHKGWEVLGVDSRTILAKGNEIDGFFHPPKAEIMLPAAISSKVRALGIALGSSPADGGTVSLNALQDPLHRRRGSSRFPRATGAAVEYAE